MASTSSTIRVREKSKIYLIGHVSQQITGSKLPSNHQVLKSLFYNIREVGLPLKEAARLTVQEVFLFWEKARIPHQLEKNCIPKVQKLYNQWRNLQKSGKRKSKSQEETVLAFISEFDNLFDIASENADSIMTNQEDKEFLTRQRQKGRPGHMLGVDLKTVRAEERRAARKAKMEELKQKSVQENLAIVAGADLERLTSRTVRQQLEKKLKLDLASRKKEIDQLVMAEVDDHANSHSEEDEVSEEEAAPPPSRKKPAADSDSDAELEDGDEKDDDDEYQPAAKKARKPKGKKRKTQDDDDDSDDDWNKKKPVAKKGAGARGGGGGGGGGGKKQSAFTKSFKLSPELADVVGSDVMPRHEVVKKLWAVIKERELQDPKNKQYAICDDQLMKVFGIKRFRTFGMMKHLKDHFLEAA